MTLKLDTTMDAYKENGGNKTFIETLSSATNIKESEFEIVEVWQGSVYVKFRVYGESDLSLD